MLKGFRSANIAVCSRIHLSGYVAVRTEVLSVRWKSCCYYLNFAVVSSKNSVLLLRTDQKLTIASWPIFDEHA